MQLDSADVVVIGGGVTGMCAAYYLAKAGTDVAVVEKEIVGWEASGRNGGGVAYHRGADPKGLMGYAETRLWHGLEEDLGYPLEFHPGILWLAMDEEELEAGTRRSNHLNNIGWKTEMVDTQTIREWVPIVNPEVPGRNDGPRGVFR